MSSLASLPERPTAGPSSPRSLLACKNAGINPEDLVYRSLSYYQSAYKDAAIAQIHFQKAEQQRQQDVRAAK